MRRIRAIPPLSSQADESERLATPRLPATAITLDCLSKLTSAHRPSASQQQPSGTSVDQLDQDSADPSSVSQLTRSKILSTGTSLLIWQVATAISGIIVARALGPSGKGIVAAALIWAQTAAWLLLLGLNTSSSVRASESRSTLDHLLGNAVLYSVGVGIVGTGAGLWFLPRALDHLGPGAAQAARITVLAIPLVMLSEVVAGINLGLGRTRHYNAARLTSGLSVLLASIALVGVRAATPQSLTAAGCFIGLAGLAVGAHGLPWRRLRVAVAALRADIAYGLRVFLTSALQIVSFRIDILVMSSFLGAAQIGYYSIATSAMLPMALVYTTTINLLIPSVAKARGARAGESVADIALIRRAAFRGTMITVAVAGAVAIALPFAVPLAFGATFTPAVALAWILLPGYVATAYATIIDAGMIGMRTPWVGNLSQGAGFLVTVCLLPLVLPTYQATGAAVISTVAYTASAVVAVWGSSRVHRQRLLVAPAPSDFEGDSPEASPSPATAAFLPAPDR
jgi:O-antigen/teichoic acid export membrane protein